MVAVLATWFFYKKIFRKDELPNPFPHWGKWEYFLSVLAGAMLGGMIISTFDGAMIPGRNPEWGILLSKSIVWALFWGVLTAELYKYFHHIKVPTGILFLPGIVLWVFAGRLGAVATGLRDFTYGDPCQYRWCIDFWDGILRHPTMIYEMILLFIFFLFFTLSLYSRHRKWWIWNGFYVFILLYFLYRFFVGFIQPYSEFWFWLSTYQIIALPMILYAGYMLSKK
jgi:hypothetical protein